MRTTWTDARITELMSLRAQGKTLSEMAAYFGVTKSSVSSQVARYNLPVVPKTRTRDDTPHHAHPRPGSRPGERTLDILPSLAGFV